MVCELSEWLVASQECDRHRNLNICSYACFNLDTSTWSLLGLGIMGCAVCHIAYGVGSLKATILGLRLLRVYLGQRVLSASYYELLCSGLSNSGRLVFGYT